MLEDCFDSLSQFALEVVENKMGVDFWHRLQFLFNIVTKYYILKSKVESGTNWKVADYETVWLSSMFMQNHKVSGPFSQS